MSAPDTGSLAMSVAVPPPPAALVVKPTRAGTVSPACTRISLIDDAQLPSETIAAPAHAPRNNNLLSRDVTLDTTNAAAWPDLPPGTEIDGGLAVTVTLPDALSKV